MASDISDFEVVGMDDWSRRLWRSKLTGILYVEVDNQLYTINTYEDWAEPNYPIGVFTNG